MLDAHVSDRGCQGPADATKTCPTEAKEAGGLGSIAEQTVEHGVDVLLGGGRDRFAQPIAGGDLAGQTVIDQAESLGYTVIGDTAGLDASTPDQKVLGLFSAGNMPQEFAPLLAEPFPATAEAQPCVADPTRAAEVPHLTDMTTKALELLDAKTQDQDKGFFLQVEGASIDKRDHAADLCGQIGETLEFDTAIQAGLAYAEEHPDTLVIVTADHGHTSQIVEYPQTEEHHSPGRVAAVVTADGQPMAVSYATVADVDGKEQSQGHTGTEVRIAAQGPQAANVVGVINQTDLFAIMARALSLD